MTVSDKTRKQNTYEYFDNGSLFTSSKETKRNRLETRSGYKNRPFTTEQIIVFFYQTFRNYNKKNSRNFSHRLCSCEAESSQILSIGSRWKTLI